jgi:hypothetical protein
MNGSPIDATTFAHQTSRMMVDRFGTIVFEDLNIKICRKTIIWKKALPMSPGISSSRSQRAERKRLVLA